MRSTWLIVVLALALAVIAAGTFIALRAPLGASVTIDLEFDGGRAHEVFLDGRSLGPGPIMGLVLLDDSSEPLELEPIPPGGVPGWPPAIPAGAELQVTTRSARSGSVLEVVPFLEREVGRLTVEVLFEQDGAFLRRTHELTFPGSPPGHSGSSAFSGDRGGQLRADLEFEVEVP